MKVLIEHLVARKAHTAESKFDERKDCTFNNIQTLTIKNVALATSCLCSEGYALYKFMIVEDIDAREYFSPGDYLDIGGSTFRIKQIENKETVIIELFLSPTPPNNGDSITPYFAIYSDRAFDLGCPEYIILDIPQFHYLKGREPSIAESYAIIPLNEQCKTIVNSGHISLDKEIKYFNPP